ncbi:MAG: ATP-dependent RecD-like DNA helicase [Desulfohalobiaceae bacterium]
MGNSLEGEIQHIVYYNPQTQYVVARLKSPSEPAQVTVVGLLGQLAPGERVALSGSWQEHPKFGRQFAADSCEQKLPAGENGIRRYLGSGLIKGLGPALAQKLVDKFGSAVLDILDQEPQKLLQVEGVGHKKLEGIKASWEKQREIRELILFLQEHAVPATFAERIFQHYGRESVRKLQQNPYDLAYEIRGIGFRTADSMAQKLGFAADSPQRLEAAIVYSLFQESEQGHLFCPQGELLGKVARMLELQDEAPLEQALHSLQEKKKVLIQDLPEQQISCAVFLRHFYRWEVEIARRVQELLLHPGSVQEKKLLQVISELQSQKGLSLSKEQQQAIKESCLHKLYIITGGPGTGKTTLTRFIVKALGRLKLQVKLAAPTGRASKRLAEATSRSAQTIHRLLGFSPGEGFEKGADKKLKADVLILDEASMLDCHLFLQVLRAMPISGSLILVGDANQLPAVGPGNILQDLLQSRVVPSLELKQIFRQARESMLVVNAHRINQGKFPVTGCKQAPEADFFWVQQQEPEKVQEMILHLVCQRIPQVYGLDPLRDIQVLSPMHKGQVGTGELNRLLQKRLNPGPATGLFSRGMQLRKGDRILQIRNNYEKNIFNGDLGWVLEVDEQAGELVAGFEGQRISYEQSELDELTLAYCLSVHKAQGSEYPAAVIPVITQHYLLLERNLIYTALTRAKQLAVLIGGKKALGMGINNQKSHLRNTHLQHRLKELLQETSSQAQAGLLP